MAVHKSTSVSIPLRGTNLRTSRSLNFTAISRHALAARVDDYLSRESYKCNPEYRLGMMLATVVRPWSISRCGQVLRST